MRQVFIKDGPMNFDSIISIFIIIVFFVLPVVLKRLQAKNKAAVKSGPVVRKKASLFERMGEQIQEFVKDLEQQARAEKEAAGKKDGIWERLAEDKTLRIETSRIKTRTDADQGWVIPGGPSPEPEKEIKPAKVMVKGKKAGLIKETNVCRLPGKYALNSRSKLRKAVVWSEILSKPMALREK